MLRSECWSFFQHSDRSIPPILKDQVGKSECYRTLSRFSVETPACFKIPKSVPRRRSWLCEGTMAKCFVVGWRRMTWLPVVRRITNPSRSRARMRSVDVSCGSRSAILGRRIRRSNLCQYGFAVFCWNRIAVFLQNCEISIHGIADVLDGFFECVPFGNASRQHRDRNGKSSFRSRF